MANVNDIADIVRILRDQPEWAETLRGVLLSKELLELPEEFAKHASLLIRTLETMNTRLDTVDQHIDLMIQRSTDVDQQMKSLTGRLDNEFGTSYENKVQRNLPSYIAQRLELRALTVLKGPLTSHDPILESDAERAAMEGKISWEEYSQMLLADLIFTARPRHGGDRIHALAEVSITAGDNDMDRARTRADILSKIRDTPVRALVISSQADDEPERKALENNVTVLKIPT